MRDPWFYGRVHFDAWRQLQTTQPSTLNLRPSTFNPQPSTLNHQPSTINSSPFTLNPQPSTLNSQGAFRRVAAAAGEREGAPAARPRHPHPRPSPLPRVCNLTTNLTVKITRGPSWGYSKDGLPRFKRKVRANERVLRQRDHVIRTLVLRRFVGSPFISLNALIN